MTTKLTCRAFSNWLFYLRWTHSLGLRPKWYGVVCWVRSWYAVVVPRNGRFSATRAHRLYLSLSEKKKLLELELREIATSSRAKANKCGIRFDIEQ